MKSITSSSFCNALVYIPTLHSCKGKEILHFLFGKKWVGHINPLQSFLMDSSELPNRSQRTTPEPETPAPILPAPVTRVSGTPISVTLTLPIPTFPIPTLPFPTLPIPTLPIHPPDSHPRDAQQTVQIPTTHL